MFRSLIKVREVYSFRTIITVVSTSVHAAQRVRLVTSATLFLLGCIVSLGITLLRRNSASKRRLSSAAKLIVKFIELVVNVNTFFNKVV